MGIFSHNIYENVRTRVIVLSEGHVLLLRAGGVLEVWRPPGGGLEPHESLAECARREVQEEAGFDVRVGRIAFLREWVVPRYAEVPDQGAGWGYGLEVYFYAIPSEPMPEPRAEVSGDPPPRWFALHDVAALPLWPKELKALCRRLAAGELPGGSPSIIGSLESPWALPDVDPFAGDA